MFVQLVIIAQLELSILLNSDVRQELTIILLRKLHLQIVYSVQQVIIVQQEEQATIQFINAVLDSIV